MKQERILSIYLDETYGLRARRGNFGFVNRVRNAFESQGFWVDLRDASDHELLTSAARPGYALFHQDKPFHPRALTMRRSYYYPFWRIEKTEKRWNFDVARQGFDPDSVDPDLAAEFCRSNRRRLFDRDALFGPGEPLVYIPLQGRLLTKRGFQSMSPMDMIRKTLEHDTEREIVLGLHPGEAYSDAEREAVHDIAERESRVTVSDAPMLDLLERCEYVVTQNSSVALAGFFFHRPAVLFARIDFHHIAGNVGTQGVQRAMDHAVGAPPEFEKYLFWFLKDTAISGAAENAESRILATVRAHGWQI